MKGTPKRKMVSTGSINQLPEDLIHHILSYLDRETEDAFQTCMFSKTWYGAWLTCPILSFHEFSRFKKREKLLKFMKRTLKRYHDQKIRIERLILGLFINDSPSDQQVDEWIGIAVQNGVEILELDFLVDPKRNGYTLPHCIFEAKSLRELSVEGNINMKKQVNDKVMLNHLNKLHLSNINIDDDMFQALIAGCPLINNLNISECKGLKIVKVTGLNNLKEFTVIAMINQDIEIEAPNLEYLHCHILGGSLNLYKTEKLKYFALMGRVPSSSYLDNFEDKFPQVENLRLSWYYKGRINITSHSLKHMVIEPPPISDACLPVSDLTGINIDAPNMIELELRSITNFPHISLTNASSQWMFKIITSDHFQDSNELNRLKLLFNALFLSCRPKEIIVQAYHDLIGHLYKDMVESTASHENMSWYEESKEVKFQIYDEIENEWQQKDWKNLPKALQHLQRSYMEFIFSF